MKFVKVDFCEFDDNTDSFSPLSPMLCGNDFQLIQMRIISWIFWLPFHWFSSPSRRGKEKRIWWLFAFQWMHTINLYLCSKLTGSCILLRCEPTMNALPPLYVLATLITPHRVCYYSWCWKMWYRKWVDKVSFVKTENRTLAQVKHLAIVAERKAAPQRIRNWKFITICVELLEFLIIWARSYSPYWMHNDLLSMISNAKSLLSQDKLFLSLVKSVYGFA